MIAILAGTLDPDRFGGKAAALAAAAAAGLPVPRGFAVPVDTLAAVVAGDPEATAAVHEAAESLGPVAVRSSAVGEDGALASFAGQYETVLAVRGPGALLAALATVHGSALRAAEYRRRLGLDGGGLAAVVQELVAPDVAGVLFTRDPMGGAGLLVEASWGLGEVVVSGLVTPDQWRLAPDGAVREERLGRKDIAIWPVQDGGTRREPVGEPWCTRACLDAATLGRLADLGRRCVAVFGAEQDVEWAVAGNEVYLLQSRPLTAVT
jgi:pyruvate,water dikinase